MFFDYLRVENFGPLGLVETSFEAKGCNVVVGPNGRGKTTFLTSLLLPILGQKASPFVETEKISFAKTRIVLKLAEGTTSESCIFDTTILSSREPVLPSAGPDTLQQRFLEALVDPSIPSIFLAPECLHLKKHSLASIVSEIRCVSVSSRNGDVWNRFLRVLGEGVGLAYGELVILGFAGELVKRERADVSLPLVIDCPFDVLDLDYRVLAHEILRRIAARDQLIIAMRPWDDDCGMLEELAPYKTVCDLQETTETTGIAEIRCSGDVWSSILNK